MKGHVRILKPKKHANKIGMVPRQQKYTNRFHITTLHKYIYFVVCSLVRMYVHVWKGLA